MVPGAMKVVPALESVNSPGTAAPKRGMGMSPRETHATMSSVGGDEPLNDMTAKPRLPIGASRREVMSKVDKMSSQTVLVSQKRPQSPISIRVVHFLESPMVAAFMMIVTVYALFADDLRSALTSVSTDPVFYGRAIGCSCAAAPVHVCANWRVWCGVGGVCVYGDLSPVLHFLSLCLCVLVAVGSGPVLHPSVHCPRPPCHLLQGFTSIALALYTVELVLNTAFKPEFSFRFYFWLDTIRCAGGA
jgi:hypothetical protein